MPLFYILSLHVSMTDTCDIASTEYIVLVLDSPPRMGTRQSTEHAQSMCPRNTQELFFYFYFQAKPPAIQGDK